MWLLFIVAHGGNYEILEGTRPAREFQEAVLTRKETLARCFASDPGPAKFHVTVGPDGLVSAAKYSLAASTDPKMLQCIYSEALKLRLVPNQDPAPTTYVWMASLASLDEPLPTEGPTPDELWVHGALSVEQVQAKLERDRAQFTFCKRRASIDGAPIPARVTVRFRVDPTGEVLTPTVTDDGGSPSVARCVSDRVAQLRFPAASGTTDISLPVEL